MLLGSLLVLVACADRPQQHWQLADGGLYSGAIMPNGSNVAIGSIFHGGSLWHIERFAREYDWNLDVDRQVGRYSVFTDMAFSGDGERVASVQGRRVVTWSASRGAAMDFFAAPAEIRSVAMNHTGDRILLGLSDGTVAVFASGSGAMIQRLDGHQGAVHAAALSANGEIALTGGDDNQAILWQINDGRILQRQPHAYRVRTVALSASGTYAFSAAQGDDGWVWNTTNGNTVRTIPAGNRGLSVVRFVDGDQMMLVGDRRHYVTLWQLSDVTRIGHWRLPGDGLYDRSSNVVLDVRWRNGEVLALSSNGKLALLQ
ncbi:MAG: hypothetical protein WED11_05735 [Natronospirillum sp.]